MTLFKLIFEHDMVLEPVGTPKGSREPSTLEDFLKPIPTYSRFYFSATDLAAQRFGLSSSDDFEALLGGIRKGMGDVRSVLMPDGSTLGTVEQAVELLSEGDGAVLVRGDSEVVPFPVIGADGSFRDHINDLTKILDNGHLVMFKVKAHHGYDLHVFSKENLYRDLFYALKPLIRSDLRFFSINGKRAKSERLFYFETWSLSRPPHGFEEVFEDTPFY